MAPFDDGGDQKLSALQIARQMASQQAQIETNSKEIEALRVHRHEHGNKLTALELEVHLVQQQVDGNEDRIRQLESNDMIRSGHISDLRSDVRVLVWRVGVITSGITGAIVFGLNLLLRYFNIHP
jgi:chromosome segregation ATPase